MNENVKKCMHCDKEFRVEDITVSMTYEYQGNEATDYLCPDCGKGMNGCTTLNYSAK